MKALFKSVNLIGDALLISPALRAWLKQQKGDVELWIQTLNDHVAPLYSGMVRDLLANGERPEEAGLMCCSLCWERPQEKFDFEFTFDVNKAFQISDQKKQHLAHSYADMLGVDIGNTKPDCKPIFIPDQNDAWMTDPLFNKHELEDCILVSMFSASCTSHDPKCNYIPNKQVPWEKWKPMLKFIRGKYPNTPIRFLGAPSDMIPNGYALDIVHPGEYMLGIPLNRLALIMQKAKMIVTIDNGMAHLASSQETPTFLMYPIALGVHYILPIGNPNMTYVHMNPVTVKAEQLLNGLQYAIKRFENTIWRKQ